MSRKLAAASLAIGSVFVILITLIVINFGGVKNRYKEIEPNLESYWAVEILSLSLERVKTALLLSSNGDYEKFAMRIIVLESKLILVDRKFRCADSFRHNKEFKELLGKLNVQMDILKLLSNEMYTGKISESAILDSLDKIEMTIIDLQEVSYRIQVKNFTEVKKIIKISAERAEIFGVLFLIVIIVMIISVIKHSLSLAEIIKRKNLFISSIHHELANSAQSIVMAADIIEHEILQADLSKEINLISYHGNNILEQTKEVMDYARLEMGENNISCNVFSINESIFNAINDLNKNNDNFFKVVYSTRKVLISTDQYKVFRIVMNLLDNANKYTIRGRIIINVKIIYNILYIRVKDNGIGFNLKKLNFLYKAFNQGAEKETRQGLGLGLTIIKNYVGLLKGRLKVKSEENVGSSFLVCIPITLVKE